MTHPNHSTPDPTNAKPEPQELEDKCRRAFRKEDGYGQWHIKSLEYRIFRDGYFAAAFAAPVVAVPEWIDINDRLPPLDAAVALLNVDKWMNTGGSDFHINWYGAGYLCDFGSGCWRVFGESRSMSLDFVTHWMALPAAPEVKS